MATRWAAPTATNGVYRGGLRDLPIAPEDLTPISKIRWNDDIDLALRVLGQAKLNDLYVVVGTIRAAAGRSLPRTFCAVIRERLQRNSRRFKHVGSGCWDLRRRNP